MKLIYDVGFHVGQDTEFYLALGFKVIAIEANPLLVEEGKIKFKDAIEGGRLSILNVGIAGETGDFTFYVNPDHTEYSSFNKEIASRECSGVQAMIIPADTLNNIIESNGAPYYVKIDIEGFDHVAVNSLTSNNLPEYISVENGFERDLIKFRELGYELFNFVDQSKIGGFELNDSKEGSLEHWKFSFSSSGPFGCDIGNSVWLGYEETLSRIRSHWNRPNVNPAVDGWYDLHACKRVTL